jgi:hypothetical protein
MFKVVFNDGSGLIWLAVISRRSTTSLIRAIANFVPKNRRQRVETGVSCANHDVCRQRQNPVPAILSARHQDVSNHATDSPARHQDPGPLLHAFREFGKEDLIVVDAGKLIAC